MNRSRLIVIALVWAILVNLPKLAGLTLAHSTGGVFAGSVVNIHDHNAYLASVRQGMMGNWRNIYPEYSFNAQTDHLPAGLWLLHASPFYAALGWLYGSTGLPINLFYVVVGLLLAFFAYLAYNQLIADCLAGDSERTIARASLFLFPGLLWINQFLQEWPSAENHVPAHILYAEGWGNPAMNPVFHNGYMPHFVAASIAATMFARSLLRAVVRRQPNYFALMSCSLLIAALIPSVAVLWVTTGTLFVIIAVLHHKVSFQHGVTMAVSISPAFLLAVWPVFLSLLGHGFWAQYTRSAYAATGVIDVWLWFLHLGVVGIVALWEMRKVLGTCSRDDAGLVLVSVWLLVTLTLSLAGFAGSPRFMDGVYLAAIILASRVLSRWTASGRTWLDWRLAAVAALILPGTIVTFLYPWIGHIYVHFDEERRVNFLGADLWPIRLTVDEAVALRLVETASGPDDIVIAGPIIGSLVPGLSGARSYVGHFFSTLDFSKKMEAVDNLGAQKSLVGLGHVTNLWIVDTVRERVPSPDSVGTAKNNVYCRHDYITLGLVTVTQYTPCT